MYHLGHQIVEIPSCLHSTFKELSNEYSHAQIRVKTKKLWPRQVGEEKQVAVRKYVATGNDVATGNGVATENLCRDQKCCRNLKKAEN